MNRELMECENDECGRMTLPLYFNAEMDGIYTCAHCVNLDGLTPDSRLAVIVQRQWEAEREAVAA